MLEDVLVFLSLAAGFAYLVLFFSMLKAPEVQRAGKLPRVSVIIAAKDEPLLGRTLKNLKKIRSPRLEIIVVASGRETIRTAKKYAHKVIVDRGVGKGPALNAAVKRASSEIIYFLDADSMVSSSTIARVCSALGDHDAAIGYNLPENSGSIVSRIARLYLAIANNVQLAIYNMTGTTFVSGRNFAIYRKTLKSMRGFADALTEDLELSLRMFMEHRKIKFVNAAAREQVPRKFSWYIKQQQRWNAGSGRVVMEWEKRFHHHDIIFMSFLLLAGSMAFASFVSLLLAFAFRNAVFLLVPMISFAISLRSAKLLGRRDLASLPLTFLAFIVVQTYALLYSAFVKPKGWYKTPKGSC